ncbi:MAG: hypothetical protein FWE53_01420 [Firmicutes bacterium]|nr:hypothetical protein [Bacillota bacterium]
MRLTSKVKFWSLIIVMLALVIFPSSIARPNQAETEAIVMAVGVDKADESYEVFLQIVLPVQGTTYAESLVIISHEGSTVAEAIEMLGLNLGKRIGFSNCKLLVLSDSVAGSNIIETLDYFFRSELLGTGIALVNTPGSAKDIIEAGSSGTNARLNSIQNIMDFNKMFVNSSEISLNRFLKEYLRPAGVSVMSVLSTKTPDEPATESETEETETSTGKLELVNNGAGSIFKSGIKIADLSYEHGRGFNWLDPDSTRGKTRVEGVTSTNFNNATVIADLIGKRVCVNAKMVNGQPIIEYRIYCTMTLSQVKQAGGNVNLSGRKSYFDNELKQKLKEEILSEITTSLDLAYSRNADLMNFYGRFNRANPKAWKEYLGKLDEPGNYLQGIDVETTVYIEGKI